MSSRSILSLVYAIHSLKDMGIETDATLKKYGFSLESLDPFGQIDRTTELKIITELMPQIDDPVCGLKLGQEFSLVGYGPFSLMLMTAPTAYEACRMGILYQNLTYLYGIMELDLSTQYQALNIRVSPLPDSARNLVIDRDLSGTYQLLTDILKIIDEPLELSEVWVPHSDMGHPERYEQLFNCPVTFNAPHSRLEIKNIDLSRPFPQSNPIAFNLYRSQCDQLLNARPSSYHQLQHQVKGYLELFEYHFPKVEEVASLLSMPERTFRRQLTHEQSSYQKILNEVRHDKARDLLERTSLTIEIIAERLGYSETASFNHAFRRWQGLSPKRYREQSMITF